MSAAVPAFFVWLLVMGAFVWALRHGALTRGRQPVARPFRIDYARTDCFTHSHDMTVALGKANWQHSAPGGVAQTVQQAPLTQQQSPEVLSEIQPQVSDTPVAPVFFNPGEPTTFEAYAGQEQIVGYLRAAIDALNPAQQAIEPQLFLGPAGLGKTLLAKVTCSELRARATRLGLPLGEFIEVFPADLADVAALDAVMRRVQASPGSVLFVDEVHDFVASHARKFYLPLTDGRYKFNTEASPVELPPFTILAATTDSGALHEAFKRRFRRWALEPASMAQLAGYVGGRGFPVEPQAVDSIVARTHWSGAPWEALELFGMAVTYARASHRTVVGLADVARVFDAQGIDAMGLRHSDRAVLRAIFASPKYRNLPKQGGVELDCYAVAENQLPALARVDAGELRASIKPRLMSRGLIEVRSGKGQALTRKALEAYPNLAA